MSRSFIISTCLFAASFFGVIFYSQHVAARAQLSPSVFFASGVPEKLEVLHVFALEDGFVGQFYDPESQQNLGLAKAARPNSDEISDSFIEVLDKTRQEHRPAGIHPALMSLALARVDSLAVTNVQDILLDVGARKISAQRFVTKADQYYIAGIVNAGIEQFLFISLRKGAAVDSQLIEKILSKVTALGSDAP